MTESVRGPIHLHESMADGKASDARAADGDAPVVAGR